MTRYSVQPRDQIFVTGYGFLSFGKKMVKNTDRDINKNVSGKYSQKLLDHIKNLQQMPVLKTSSERVIQKSAETTGNLIANRIAHKITKVSNNLQQNNSDIVTNEHDKEILKERCIYPEVR